VIDVGANIGQFAVACAKLFPDVVVHSFEPQPEAVKQLGRNVAGLESVRVYPVALGAEAGEATLHVNSHSHSSSFLKLGARHRSAFPRAEEMYTIKVPLSTLDEAMQTGSLEPPMLLKLDVQGYEPQVLAGATATLKNVAYVLMELSFRPLYEGEATFMQVAADMEAKGFRLLRPVGWLDDPCNGEVLQVDALFEQRGGDA